MNDFFEILKNVYIICSCLALAAACCFLPIILGCHFQSAWWGFVEVITAPVGVALGVWTMEYIDKW